MSSSTYHANIAFSAAPDRRRETMPNRGFPRVDRGCRKISRPISFRASKEAKVETCMSCRRGSGDHLTLYAEETLTRKASIWAAVGAGKDNASMTYQYTCTTLSSGIRPAAHITPEKTEHIPEEKLYFRWSPMLNARMFDQAGV